MKTRLFLVILFSISNIIVFASTWLDRGFYDISWFNPSKSTFIISTPQQLAGIAYLVNNRYTDFDGKNIQLENDIDLEDASWVGIGSKNYYFMGSFDGNGHRISNIQMFLERGVYPHIGFFNCIYKSTIRNLNLSGYISLNHYDAAYPETIVGGLCAWAKDSKIERVTSSVRISYYRTKAMNFNYKLSLGGLIGEAENYTNITDSYYNDDIHVEFLRNQSGTFTGCSIYVGGIIGESDNATITKCGRPFGNFYVNANCSSSNTSNLYTNVGGIVGSARSSNISYCYNNSPKFEIYIGSNSGLKFGGIAGYSSIYGSNGIINCYSSSKEFHVNANQINGVNYGGIIGYLYPNNTPNLKANYSPSDIFVSCNHSLYLVEGYVGSKSFTSSQMKESDFLNELNIYSVINTQNQIWENKYFGSTYPIHKSQFGAVFSPTVEFNDTLSIYDLQGRKVHNPRQGQIYIRAGKKFIHTK